MGPSNAKKWLLRQKNLELNLSKVLATPRHLHLVSAPTSYCSSDEQQRSSLYLHGRDLESAGERKREAEPNIFWPLLRRNPDRWEESSAKSTPYIAQIWFRILSSRRKRSDSTGRMDGMALIIFRASMNADLIMGTIFSVSFEIWLSAMKRLAFKQRL